MKITRKLGRTRNPRRALMRSLAAQLITNGKIKTTEAKARTVRPFVEHLVTAAKKDTIASRRYIARYLTPGAAHTLAVSVAPRHKERPGGYTRIIKLGARRSDSAKMAYIEFV